MAYDPRARFEWDLAKAAANFRKHGVSFEEARGLLSGDGPYIERSDGEHGGEEEERFVVLGFGRRGLITVAFQDRGEGVVRIISARRAVASEIRDFLRIVRRMER